MSTTRAPRDRGVRFRCRACGLRKVGPSDLVACPDCGGPIVQFRFGPRKARKILPPASDG